MRFVTSRGRARSVQASLGTALIASLWLVVPPASASAVDSAGAEAVAGRWDISLADTNRKCEIRLRSESDAAGHAISMPAGCRRAMPILAEVGAWTLAAQGQLEFEDGKGRQVLEFMPASAGELVAKGPQGESYRLVAASDDRQIDPFAPVQVATTAGGFRPMSQAGTNGAATEIAAANGPTSAPAGTFTGKPADVAGRYALLRAAGKDTGCMLTLDDKTRGPHGSFKAILAPGCSDQGLLIFDPVGWQIERGRLALIARKGHQTHLDLQPDGIWTKDPKEGQPLGLMRK